MKPKLSSCSELIFSPFASGAVSALNRAILLDVGPDTTHTAVWEACNLKWRILHGKS